MYKIILIGLCISLILLSGCQTIEQKQDEYGNINKGMIKLEEENRMKCYAVEEYCYWIGNHCYAINNPCVAQKWCMLGSLCYLELTNCISSGYSESDFQNIIDKVNLLSKESN